MNFGELLGFITAINNQVNDEPNNNDLEQRIKILEAEVKTITSIMESNNAKRTAIAEALKKLNERLSTIEEQLEE